MSLSPVLYLSAGTWSAAHEGGVFCRTGEEQPRQQVSFSITTPLWVRGAAGLQITGNLLAVLTSQKKASMFPHLWLDRLTSVGSAVFASFHFTFLFILISTFVNWLCSFAFCSIDALSSYMCLLCVLVTGLIYRIGTLPALVIVLYVH